MADADLPTSAPVVLASASPRRRELLGTLGVPFEVVVSGADEASVERRPGVLAAQLARLKGRSVAAIRPDAVVIAADTVVSCEGHLLEKPQDATENAEFIRRLAGRVHDVYTGVAVFAGAHEWHEVAHTAVRFRALTEAEIAFYARSGEGLDKAGGYGIQGLGAVLVDRIEGEFTNVVGFPLSVVVRLLRQAGVPVWGERSPGGAIVVEGGAQVVDGE